jgi:hypothetical protein
MTEEKPNKLGYAWQWTWVTKRMVDFTVSGKKKSPIYISICVGLTIVGTTATLLRIQLTTHFDVSLEASFCMDTIIPLSKKLPMMTSFYFLLMPVVYHVLYYAFSQDLFKTGQISNQHEKVDSQCIAY